MQIFEIIKTETKSVSSKTKFRAFGVFAGIILVSLLMTSAARVYNYNHFAEGLSGFLPDSFGDQVFMFSTYALLNIGALIYAYRNASKNKNKNSRLLLSASLVGVGVAGLLVLAAFFAFDFLTLVMVAYRFHMGFGQEGNLLDAYLAQYGKLYFIPALISLMSFALLKKRLKKIEPETSGDFGTASFAQTDDFEEMGAYDEEGVLFGKDDEGNYLRCTEDGNRLILAQPDGGKSTGVIMPTLLSENRPMFVNDPKGELWGVTARYRHIDLGRDVVVLDPFSVTREPKFLKDKPESLINKVYTFNPLEMISDDPKLRDRHLDAIVESLITPVKEVTSTSSHFNTLTKMILRGFIEWVISTYPDKKANLVSVHDLLSLPEATLQLILHKMSDSGLYHAKRAANFILNSSKGEHRDSINGTVAEQLSWLSDLNMREFVASSNFDLTDFMKGNMDVYIVLPTDQNAGKSKFVRIVLACLSNLFVQTPEEERPQEKTFFIFDELGQLGYFPDIETMIFALRSFGIVVWAVFQSRGQIMQYKDHNLFEGAPIKQFFNVDDPDTMEWVQKLGGTKTIYTRGESTSKSKGSKNDSRNESVSQQETGTKLIPENEIRELQSDLQYVFIRGRRPILCKKLPYFKEPLFEGRYDPNPVEKSKKQKNKRKRGAENVKSKP